VDGKPDSEPVLWSREVMQAKRRDMGPYVFACQILVDPKADEAQGFLEPWLKFHGMHLDKLPRNYNYYLLCDPAGEKKRENDYTVMAVVATAPDKNIYVIDFIRDRLNLTERTETMFRLHRKYRPVKVGYEQYGLQADVEHIEYVQEIENYRFPIIKLGGSTPKNDRIRKLIPIFEQGRFYMPARVSYVDYQRHEHDLTREFIDEEFLPFPVGSHDDILDCFARIIDPELGARFPLERKFNDDAIQLGQRPSPQENRRRGYSEVYA
jgi:predicted phage terminase large subunit-like protein